MANQKNLVALFDSEITAPNGTQKGITLVSIPEGEKTWVATTVAFENNRIVLLKTTNARKMQRGLLTTLFPACSANSEDTTRTLPEGTLVKLTSKIATGNLPMDTAQARSAKLTDADFVNGGSTLQVFLANNGYDLDPSIQDTTTNLNLRKVAFPREQVNYDLFWNSPLITDEEKKVCTPSLDLDICMGNAARPCYQLFEKVMTTSYPTKKFTAIGLHGNPGGGKSQMVTNWCALKHIPLVTIPCDPLMSITQILSQVGPQQTESVVDKATVAPLVQGLKAKLEMLKQAPCPSDPDEKRDYEKQVQNTLEALDKIATLSKETADLVKTPSILMKCLKNNLPLVVFFDEANIASTAFQNSLAPIMSDGVYKDGPLTGRNNNTIKWILAWNPRTSNVKSFDGKFFDRLFFIQVPDLSAAEELEYTTRQIAAATIDVGTPDTAPLEAWRKKVQKGVEAPVLADIVAQATAMPGSGEAKAWYASYLLKQKFPSAPVFKEGKFMPAYLDEVQMMDRDAQKAAIAAVYPIADAANTELEQLTLGKDTRNPDKQSYYYISKRNKIIFLDMVMAYSSVRAGLVGYIYNLIPGGGTLKSGGTVNPSNDTTPAVIAMTVATKLEGQCEQAQNVLFSPTPSVASVTDAPAADDIIAAHPYAADIWVEPTPVDVPTVEHAQDSADVNSYLNTLTVTA